MNAAGYSAKAHPVGMQRSVENGTPYAQRHPVRDASLSGCGVTRGAYPSTERYSLTGMQQTRIPSLRSAAKQSRKQLRIEN